MGSENEDREMMRITQPIKAVKPKEAFQSPPLDFCPICQADIIKTIVDCEGEVRRIIHPKCFKIIYKQMLTPESPLRQEEGK
jgi:hypothetical protein